MIETIRQSADMLTPRLRRRWLKLIPMVLFVGSVEAVGTAAIFILIQFLTSPEKAQQHRVIATLRDWAAGMDQRHFIALFAVLVAALYISKNLLKVIEMLMTQRCVRDSVVYMSNQLLHRYLAAPYAFHLRRNSADLMRNTLSAVDTVCKYVLGAAVSLVTESFIVISIIVVLVLVTPRGAILASSVVSVLMIALLWLTHRQNDRWGARSHELAGAASSGRAAEPRQRQGNQGAGAGKVLRAGV